MEYMSDKKRKYPFDFSDKEIFENIGTPLDDNDYDPGSPAKRLKIMVGLTEIQRRGSKRFTRWSVFLSVSVIILSLVAVYFSYNAYRTSVDWQTEQLKILEEIKNELKILEEIKNELKSAPSTQNSL